MNQCKQNAAKWLRYGMLSAVTLALQLTVLPGLFPRGAGPFLPPILLGCIVTFESGGGVLLYALLLGSWCDAFRPGELLFTLLYPMLAWGIQRLSQNVYPKTVAAAFAWSTVVSLLGQLLYGLFHLWMPGYAGVSALWTVLAPELLYSLLFVPPLWWLVRAMSGQAAAVRR